MSRRTNKKRKFPNEVNFTVLYHRDHNVPVLVVSKLEVVTSSNAHEGYVCVFIKLHITAQSGPVIYSFYATACNPPGGYLS